MKLTATLLIQNYWEELKFSTTGMFIGIKGVKHMLNTFVKYKYIWNNSHTFKMMLRCQRIIFFGLEYGFFLLKKRKYPFKTRIYKDNHQC